MARNSKFLDETKDAVPEAERRPILLRTYAEPKTKEPRTKKSKTPEWVLVFDTETTADESQRLRFGTFQLWRSGKFREQGIFYDTLWTPPAQGDLLTSAGVECANLSGLLRDCSRPWP